MKQFREVNGGGGQFYSQGKELVHFGLGQIGIIDSITVQWPSGISQTLNNISPNQMINVIEQ